MYLNLRENPGRHDSYIITRARMLSKIHIDAHFAYFMRNASEMHVSSLHAKCEQNVYFGYFLQNVGKMHVFLISCRIRAKYMRAK